MGGTTVAMVQKVDPFRVKVDGEVVEVDHGTFTLTERRAARVAVRQITDSDDLQADEADAIAALVWIVLRRATPDLPFEDVLESLTIADLADAEPVGVQELEDRDDDPEA